MIPVGAFLSGVKAIMDSRPTYRLGGSGTDGTCDCIGLIIGAIRRAGGEWRGAHGSNWAARNAMVSLTEHPRLEPGAVMYKAHDPGGRGYALPDTYKAHPDQRDYYHVGVVLSASPLRIAHCTSWGGGSGIKVDTAIGKWRYSGRLKAVQYDQLNENEVTPMTGYIDLPADETVFLRISPSKSSAWFARVPGQAAVEIVSSSGEWTRVRYGGKDGYVMSKFIATDPAAQPDPMPPDVVDVDKAALLTELEGLNKRQAVIIAALKGVM